MQLTPSGSTIFYESQNPLSQGLQASARQKPSTRLMHSSNEA